MSTHIHTHNEADMAFARRLHEPSDVSFNASVIRQAIEAATAQADSDYWMRRCAAVERAADALLYGEAAVNLVATLQEYHKEEHERSVARSEGSRGAPFTDVL
jgi:hypothetical protein